MPPAATKPQAASSAAKAQSKHLVNVGLFAQEANADHAMAKLKEAGLPAYTEEIRSPTKGKLTRVRVGPFTSDADAEAAAVKIRALGLDALLVRQ
jgi:DedD protein